MHFAEIYTKPECPYCVKAKEFMQGMEIPYKETIVGADITWEELLSAAPGITTVPQIWINGSHVGGYEELITWVGEN